MTQILDMEEEWSQTQVFVKAESSKKYGVLKLSCNYKEEDKIFDVMEKKNIP